MKEKNKNPEISYDRFRIGDYLFDCRSGRLTGTATDLRLEPQVGEFLHLLVRHAGEVVSRDIIAGEIWSNRVVSDDALRAMVKKLREALGDDARNPRYIKTLPLKGYALIAPTKPLRPAHNGRAGSLLLAGSALLALLLGIGAYVALNSPGEQSDIASVEQLTSLPGSELSPDYSAATDRLLFSHRANKDDHLQLYVKSPTTQRVQRLTWDEANYANAFWSPDGNRLVYTRSTRDDMQHFRAEFDPEQGILNPQPLAAEAAHDKFLLGWSADGRSVYLKDAFQPARPQGIWRFQFDGSTLEQITAPSVQGIGDYFARESRDGRMLALLRSIEEGKRELLIVDIPTGSLLHTRILPEPADRLTWRGDGSSLTLSSFDGALLQYRLADDRFVSLNNPSSYINDVFFQCGDRCYFMRRHNGNFLDLQEEPTPFANQSMMSSDSFNLPGAEDFPLYAPSGNSLYFVARRDGALLLQRQGRLSGAETLATLPADTQVKALTIDASGHYLAGVIDKRIFIFDLEARELRYLTRDIDLAGPPTWAPDGAVILYSKSEKGQPSLYKHKIGSGKPQLVDTGYIAARQLDESRMLAVDTQQRAWLIEEGEVLRQVAALPSVIPNRWQVSEQWLYYTEHVGNNAYINRINLTSGETERKLLAKNRFRLNFDMHPQSARMLTVKSLLAESDLVRLSLAR
ncbi:winged helix-turn-helix domain-containing protein [Microbulbifer marinus]|uniref:DNA-binding winged helix-turn-helix (WHTH) domain-containing protein n=1 Tax=Microbulbifer marinus TaxID=658218 RepID=A0A1H3ZFM1_9GAMM|nr:winged helix-turn-helix domain-containing protein [Microbulbifer marinus]SEA22144.1 DNA-binding winged helix-turn-helix (wHTH) domain-containing protein [Microbulbifer marinus]